VRGPALRSRYSSVVTPTCRTSIMFSSPDTSLVFDVTTLTRPTGPVRMGSQTTRRVARGRLFGTLVTTTLRQERIARAAAEDIDCRFDAFAGEDRLPRGTRPWTLMPWMADLGGFFTVNAIHRIDQSSPTPVVATRVRRTRRMIVDGKDGPRIVAKPPLLVPLSQLDEAGTDNARLNASSRATANVEQRPSSAALAVHAGRRPRAKSPASDRSHRVLRRAARRTRPNSIRSSYR